MIKNVLYVVFLNSMQNILNNIDAYSKECGECYYAMNALLHGMNMVIIPSSSSLYFSEIALAHLLNVPIGLR